MSLNIYEILNALAATSKRSEKEQILKSLSPELESLFKEVVKATYDPFINYWIRSPQVSSDIRKIAAGTVVELQRALNELIPLKERTYTGNAARDHLAKVLANSSYHTANIISRVVDRDLRVGCSVSTFNKIWPGLIPEFELMACHTLDEKTAGSMVYPAYAQLKYDAARVAIIVNHGTVSYRTRNGLTYNFVNVALDNLFLTAAMKLGRESLVFDGELYQRLPNGQPASRTVSNGIATKMIRGTSTPEDWEAIGISVWDVVPLESFIAGYCKTSYSERFDLIKQMFPEVGVVQCANNVMVKDYDEAVALAKKYIAKGFEGIILKNPNAPWEAKRSKNCLKVKAVRQADLEVVELVEGTGKYTGKLGAVTCKSVDGLLQVNVGTGFSDAQRESLWSIRDELQGTILTVEYNELIKPKNSDVYSLFLPRAIEFRDDKNVADDLAKIQSGT